MKLLSRFALFVGWALLLAACAQPPAPTAALRLGLSPALGPLQAAIGACMPLDGGLQVSLVSLYPGQADLEEFDLYFRLGEADEPAGFAAQIAWEQVGLALPAANPAQVSAAQAADLFAGRIADWSALEGPAASVSLYAPPPGDEARQAFERQILRGRLAGETILPGDPAQLRAAVAADPGGAGILPLAWAGEGVAVQLLGLRLPVLALAAEPPSGPAHALLACLQGPMGQAALGELYEGLGVGN